MASQFARSRTQENSGPIARIFPHPRQEPKLPAGFEWDQEKARFCPKNLLVPPHWRANRMGGMIQSKQSRLGEWRDIGLVFCHRGLYERASTIIENSTSALENGSENAFYLHELDVFVWDKLEKAFVAHDQVAHRVTTKRGRWEHYPLQEILETLLVSRDIVNAFIEEPGAPDFADSYRVAKEEVLGVLDAIWRDVLEKSGRTVQLDLREEDLAKAIPYYSYHISKLPYQEMKYQGAHHTLIYKMFESTMWKGYNVHYSYFHQLDRAIQERSIEQYNKNYFERRHLLLCPPLIMVFFTKDLVKLAESKTPKNSKWQRNSYDHIYDIAMESISSFVEIDVGVPNHTYNFVLEIGHSGLGLGYNVETGEAKNPLNGKPLEDPDVIFDSLVDRAMIDVALEIQRKHPKVLFSSCTRLPDVITPKGKFKAAFRTAELVAWPEGEKGLASELRAMHGGLYPQSNLVVADNPAAEVAARVWIDTDRRLNRRALLEGVPYDTWLANGSHNNDLVNAVHQLNSDFVANTVGDRPPNVTLNPSKAGDAVVRSWRAAGALGRDSFLGAGTAAPRPGSQGSMSKPEPEYGGPDYSSPLVFKLQGREGFIFGDTRDAARAFARLVEKRRSVGDGASSQPVSVRIGGKRCTFHTLAEARRSVGGMQAYQMALKGRIGRLREFLQGPSKADINALSGPHGTPLGAACATNQIGSVRLLMEYGADLNHGYATSSCPLVLACHYGNVEVVRLLVGKGADVNIFSTMFGLTPLEEASRQGRKDIVEILLIRVKKDRIDDSSRQKHLNSALQIACAGGHETVVTLLLNEGANASLEGEPPFGSALAAACGRAHHANEVSIEEKLRRRGANVNYNGHTSALVAACGRGSLFVVEKLLEWGAEINSIQTPPEGSEYRSALAAACEHGHLPVVRLLLAKGADVNLPLSRRPSRSTERAWLGDDLYETVGRADRSALHHACTSGNAEIVKLLLGKGARIDFTIIPNNSFTPEILSLLRDAGVQYSQPIVGARSKLDNAIARNRNMLRAEARSITPTDERHVMLVDGRLDHPPIWSCGCLVCLLDEKLQPEYEEHLVSRGDPVSLSISRLVS